VVGPAGSGRTALLLALAGRFRLREGAVTVDGHRLPGSEREVRRLVGIARARPAVDLEERLRVDELVAERLLVSRSAERAAIERAFELLQLDIPGRALVQELAPLDRLRLALALGLAGGPRGLVVDDVDDEVRGEEVVLAWALVDRVREQGVTLLTSASAPPPGTTARWPEAGAPAQPPEAGSAAPSQGAETATPATGKDAGAAPRGPATVLVALPHAAEVAGQPSAVPSGSAARSGAEQATAGEKPSMGGKKEAT
jgi:ABC-type transport system involved in cytochrome c biogenesis ATPase subunit